MAVVELLEEGVKCLVVVVDLSGRVLSQESLN